MSLRLILLQELLGLNALIILQIILIIRLFYWNRTALPLQTVLILIIAWEPVTMKAGLFQTMAVLMLKVKMKTELQLKRLHRSLI